MNEHPVLIDLGANIICLLIIIKLTSYFGFKNNLSVGFAVSLGLLGAGFLFFISAQLFHVSFWLIPVNGGLAWNKTGRFVFMMTAGAFAAFYFYARDYVFKKPKR